MTDTSTQLIDVLTEINITDLLDSAGLLRLQNTALRRLFWPVARRFARTAHEFDTRVGDHGLSQGSAWLIEQMTAGVEATGLENIPKQGPVFILSNHPGMTDTVALFTCLAARPDLRVIALDRPFLRALPNVAKHLFFLPDDEAGRMAVMRAGARHLKKGGALLTFPAGTIEPDPATAGPKQAAASLQHWSDSHALFARLAPETQFVPALVSHVISADATRHPLTLLRRTPEQKAKLAAALQVALPRYRKLVAKVAFGEASRAEPQKPQALGITMIAAMHKLIFKSSPANSLGESVLATDPDELQAQRQPGF